MSVINQGSPSNPSGPAFDEERESPREAAPCTQGAEASAREAAPCTREAEVSAREAEVSAREAEACTREAEASAGEAAPCARKAELREVESCAQGGGGFRFGEATFRFRSGTLPLGRCTLLLRECNAVSSGRKPAFPECTPARAERKKARRLLSCNRLFPSMRKSGG